MWPFPLYVFSSVSPSNVHHRLLNFMRPESMPTDSPADIHQSLLNKYKGTNETSVPTFVLNCLVSASLF